MECNHCSCGQDVKEKLCIARVPIFNNLTFEEMMEIASLTKHREYKKGETIYLVGEKLASLYVINEGKVKISKISETGKEQIIRILGPGEFMGELSLFSHFPINHNAEALEPTKICVIEGQKIKNIINSRLSIAAKIIEELSKRLQNAENLIESLGLHDVEQRVAGYLLQLADDGGQINLSISKKDLAAHMGMSQETLSRRLSVFQEMGLIKQIGQRKINILDKDGLQAIANI
jgi:CRP-like cAMP-binding protein